MADVRRAELSRASLAFATLWLIVGSYTLVKTVRDAVFLSKFGVTEISVVAIGLALLAGVVITIYQRVTKNLSKPWLIASTHTIIAASLAALWFALVRDPGAGWIAWVLYIWSSLFGVFIVMQFWLLAGDLFDLRQAKRLFGIIGAGAILGGLTGGLVAQLLATRVSAAALLLIAGGMLVVAALFAHVVWPMRVGDGEPERKETSESSIVELFSKPTFVRLIAIGLLLSTVATTLLDWQFKTIAKHAFEGRTDAMAGFFGSLFAYQSGASLLFQLVVTGWLLRRLGVGFGRNVLPIALLAGAAVILVHPALSLSLLVAATGAKVAEGGLRFAIDKATVELTWLPLPKNTRDRSKGYVDTVVDRLGTGVTGVVWLMLAAVGLDAPDRVYLISVLSVAIIAAWLWMLRQTQVAYVDAFRESLSHRSIDLDSLRMGLGEAEAQRTISETLESDDPAKVRFGLYLLSGSDLELPDLSKPLAHDDAMVRIRTLQLLAQNGDPSYRDRAEAILTDTDATVREAAIVYLRATRDERLDSGLESGDSADASDELRFSYAIVALGEDPAEAELDALHRAVAPGLPDRLSLISQLGAAQSEVAAAVLRPLLDDDDPLVVGAALEAAGRAHAYNLADALGDKLHDPHLRPKVVKTLAELGVRGVSPLIDRLEDDQTPLDVKRAIIRLAGASRSSEMVEPLDALLDKQRALKHAATHALARLAAHVRVEMSRPRVTNLLIHESELLFRDLLLLDRGGWPLARKAQEGEDLFERAVRESATDRVRRIFAMMSWLHGSGDIRDAFRGIRSPLRAVRAKSVEFLDNLLAAELRDPLLPPLEDTEPQQLRAAARRIFGLKREKFSEALSRVIAGVDPWLQAVACFTVGHNRIAALRGDVAALRGEQGMLGPIAQRSIQQIDDPNYEEPTVGLTLVEKAIRLRTVDVLQRASSEDLAYVAQIAEEIELEPETTIYGDGDVPDALYVVINGKVELMQADVQIGVIGAGDDFGSWALVDDAPRVASATTRATTTVLKVAREDFIDLLADRADIVQAVFKAMVERIRNLADLARDDED